MKKSCDSISALQKCPKKWAAGISSAAQNLQPTDSSSLREFEGGQQGMFSSFFDKTIENILLGKGCNRHHTCDRHII